VSFETLLGEPRHGAAHEHRRALMLPELNLLSQMHFERCEPYKRIINGIWGGKPSAAKIEDLPFLPVSIFKTHTLQSVPSESIQLTLTSSGTTGQAVSKVMVDSETSLRQQSALTNSLTHVLGKKRLPMVVIDTRDVYRNPAMMNARGAGVLGMMRFGRDHAFALKPDLSPDFEALEAFLKKLDGAPFFMFGFTFLVWSRFFEAFQNENLDLSQGILIHSGGWKKMADNSVDNAVFHTQFAKKFSLHRIYNFYGMVEQMGSIFLEGPRDLLYPPNFSDVIIRDPQTWQPVPAGTPGLIQVLSLVPKSYPGNSLLTEDMGVIEAIDPNIDGWMGPGLRVIGRVPKAELRGCSDVVASYAA
jgi:Acyl-protein synthetase, LuxE